MTYESFARMCLSLEARRLLRRDRYLALALLSLLPQ